MGNTGTACPAIVHRDGDTGLSLLEYESYVGIARRIIGKMRIAVVMVAPVALARVLLQDS